MIITLNDIVKDEAATYYHLARDVDGISIAQIPSSKKLVSLLKRQGICSYFVQISESEDYSKDSGRQKEILSYPDAPSLHENAGKTRSLILSDILPTLENASDFPALYLIDWTLTLEVPNISKMQKIYSWDRICCDLRDALNSKL
ncbi:MAG: hypothetical protein HGA85_08945 [Nanoarchaeota archaeon]|nr:hypothetical protein [Nanoarchaeota archaeon]